MKVHHILVSDIEIRARLRPATPEYVDGLAGDMDKRGLRSPVEVSEGRDGQPYILVSGLHRLMAARQLGWETIPAFIVSGSNEELRLDELLENLQRNELTPCAPTGRAGRSCARLPSARSWTRLRCPS